MPIPLAEEGIYLHMEPNSFYVKSKFIGLSDEACHFGIYHVDSWNY